MVNYWSDASSTIKIKPMVDVGALILEALTLLERSRDQLLLKPEDRIKMGEITAFIKRCNDALELGERKHRNGDSRPQDDETR